MDLGLGGRHVVVTGASKGIGRACAEVFAAEGCRLSLVARTGDALDRAADELVGRHGVDVTTHALDLSTSLDQAALAEAVGDVDILVNNAGAIPSGDLVTVDEET